VQHAQQRVEALRCEALRPALAPLASCHEALIVVGVVLLRATVGARVRARVRGLEVRCMG